VSAFNRYDKRLSEMESEHSEVKAAVAAERKRAHRKLRKAEYIQACVAAKYSEITAGHVLQAYQYSCSRNPALSLLLLQALTVAQKLERQLKQIAETEK
jgi:hypothetical protein